MVYYKPCPNPESVLDAGALIDAPFLFSLTPSFSWTWATSSMLGKNKKLDRSMWRPEG